jgi:hypothetical protein
MQSSRFVPVRRIGWGRGSLRSSSPRAPRRVSCIVVILPIIALCREMGQCRTKQKSKRLIGKDIPSMRIMTVDLKYPNASKQFITHSWPGYVRRWNRGIGRTFPTRLWERQIPPAIWTGRFPFCSISEHMLPLYSSPRIIPSGLKMPREMWES